MELRKQGKIPEREKYEGAPTRGIIVPGVPFGVAKYDQGERFDLRLPYVDDGRWEETCRGWVQGSVRAFIEMGRRDRGQTHACGVAYVRNRLCGSRCQPWR